MTKTSQHVFRGWSLFLCGICMGAADLVPGISGGTIAFILGFYSPLLDSLKTLNRSAFQSLLQGQWRDFSQKVAWKFLLTLLTGIICAFISLANFFHFILDHEIYRVYLYATFMGLILASFVFCLRQVQTWNWKLILGLVLSACLAYALTSSTSPASVKNEYAIEIDIQPTQHLISNYDPSTRLLTNLSTETLSVLVAQGIVQRDMPVFNAQHGFLGQVQDVILPHQTSFFNGWLVLCGALAVAALLLPGISGSYVLTLLGVYPLVIEALVDFLHDIKHVSFNYEAFAVLWSLAVGIALGALAFARVLSWVLRVYPNQSLALLSGFMMGAMRSVWPFWTFEYALMPLKLTKGPQLVALQPFMPTWNDPLLWQAGLCTLGGFLLVFALEMYAQRRMPRPLPPIPSHKKTDQDEKSYCR